MFRALSLACLVGLSSARLTDVELSPIILVPGLAASGLEMKVDSAHPVYFCDAYADDKYHPVWANPISMSLLYRNCWRDRLLMLWDDSTSSFRSKEGVDVRPHDYGGVHGIDYMTYTYGSIPIPGSDSYATAVDFFKKQGYTVGTNLFGAPYDWRRGPAEMDYKVFTGLIELSYAINKSPAHLVVHSMGSIFASYFLNNIVSAEWKEKYVASLTVIAGALGGSVKTLKGLLSGYNDELTFDLKIFKWSLLPELFLRDMFRTFGSFYAMVPHKKVYGDEVLVTVRNNNDSPKEYTAETIVDLMPEALRKPYEVYQAQSEIALNDPGVPVNCYWSRYERAMTESSYVYIHINSEKDLDQSPISEHADGDGMVRLASLQWCLKWNDVRSKEYVNINHYKLLNHIPMLDDIFSYVNNLDEPLIAEVE